MATEASLINSVRIELGDHLETFRDSFRGNGTMDDYRLPARNVTQVTVDYVDVNDDVIRLTSPTDYTLEPVEGIISFTTTPAQDVLYILEGKANGIFTDDEIVHFLDAAISQHLKGRTVQKRYRDGHGFIRYDRGEMELEDLPREEEVLVTLLTTIEALWALSTDASLDIDVQTAEGTSIPRGQRHRQLLAQIGLLTDKYNTLSLAMGVGLLAPETLTVRRVSRSNGRLVPVFASREYDETGPPIRKLPPRGNRDEDPDGPASPLYPSWGY